MKHSISHDLDPPTVRRAAERALSSYQMRFPEAEPRVTWRDAKTADLAFSIKGVKLKGTVVLEAKTIDVDLDVPLLFRPFRSKALKVVEEEIKKWLVEAKAGRI
jgi:hypothetical protein